MGYRVWYSTESLANYIIDKTDLSKEQDIEKRNIYESDASSNRNFHTLPDHIKKILYLDSPDLIVEKNLEPIFSLEISKEAGTGHNAFQRFSRLAASIENGVPSFYIYPEAVVIERKNSIKWDKINPLIFQALKKAMDIYSVPALLYFFPTDFKQYYANPEASPNFNAKGLIYDRNIIDYMDCPDSTHVEMKNMFQAINQLLNEINNCGVIDGRRRAIRLSAIVNKKDFMEKFYYNRAGTRKWSPLTSVKQIPTYKLIKYLSNFHSLSYKVGDLINSREETIIYCINASFRGDPYPGALAAIDYIKARQGKTFEDRYYNLVLAWGKVRETEDSLNIEKGNNQGIKAFCNQVSKSEKLHNILNKNYSDLKDYEISRYYMQVRYGSMFSKVKHIRIFSYFADAILFYDGALWRDG